jgi:NAD(P)-dependent dehydrogenase (short-subunit alcohol dehydrogenase family)
MTNIERPSPIRTPYGFDSTAAEVVAGVDLNGSRAIVTGGGSGIGIETARALAGAGAHVTLAVRDLAQGERVASQLGADRVGAATLDLADLASVDAFVDGWEGPLDILVCNAGVMMLPQLTLTPAGYELQFATNHLGHMALAIGLHDALAAAASARGDARVAVVSSVGHLLSRVVFDDIQFSARPYDPALAYGQSKTAEILFAVEADRRWAGDGITVDALHPGAILETGLARHIDPDDLDAIVESGVYTWKTPEQGAATSVLVATWPPLRGIGGRYFENCNEAAVVDPEAEPNLGAGVAEYALEPGNAARLWDVSLALLGAARG